MGRNHFHRIPWRLELNVGYELEELKPSLLERSFLELKKKKKKIDKLVERNMGHSRKEEPCDGRNLELGRNSCL